MAKLSSDQIEKSASRILESHKQLAKHRAKTENLIANRREDIAKGLGRGDIAIWSGFGWTMSAPPGGTITGRVGITFPDPSIVPDQSDLYVHVWIGSGNIDPVPGTFLSNVDTRFPRLTEPRPPGLRPGLNQVPEIHVHPDSALLDFKLRIPSQVEQSVYLGNMCLMRRSAFDTGEYLGRASFLFRVRGIDEPPDTHS